MEWQSILDGFPGEQETRFLMEFERLIFSMNGEFLGKHVD